jgi:uncharacterized membrane protein YcaP (DUF421 family)
MRTIINAIIGYWFLLLTVRVLTRRPGAQMTPFEFVLVFLIGGVIILATVGDDHSLTNCVCAILTIALMHRLVAQLRVRSHWFAEIIDGTPLVLINKGQWQTEVMRDVRLLDDDVMAAARTKNVATFDQIEYAILERNGSISIIKREEQGT